MKTNIVYNGDSCEILNKIEDNSIDLVVTSPPYDNLRNYDGVGDTWNHEKFQCVANHLYYVVKDGGVVVWVVNDKVENGSKSGTSFRQALYFMEIGFNLNDTMIWCLSGTTQLYAKTPNKIGPMPIRELVRLNPQTVQLWNGNKWVNVVGWQENNIAKTKYQLCLRSGERIYCTAEHKWVLDNGNEVSTSDLTCGDILQSCNLPDNDYHQPVYLTKDVLWLIGLYIAEGSRSGGKHKIQLSLNADEIEWVDRIQNAIETLGGNVGYTINGNALNVRIFSDIFDAILEKYVGGRTSHNKHLKTICWSMSNEFLREIMKGYLEGDGHYDEKNNRWRLGFTKNRKLETTIRTMAARLNATLTLLPGNTKCMSKVFKTLRGEWRWTNSDHFNVKSRNEILSIKQIKMKKTDRMWDIEVDSEDHLFSLASGVLTHNCKKNPMPVVKQPRYTPRFEYMFVFSKGKPKTFNPIMRECKCGGQEYKSTAKNMGGENGRRDLHYNVNKEMVDYNVWEIAVDSNRKVYNVNCKPIKHPAVFPYEIPHNHIQTWTNKGDIVLDPFAGSGTTLIAARDLERNYIGIELNTDYCEIINQRMNLKDG